MSINKGLLVVMFMGAAIKDATPEQKARLRGEALTALGDRETDPTTAMSNAVLITAEIMGEEWRPTGEWGEWITSLLDASAPGR